MTWLLSPDIRQQPIRSVKMLKMDIRVGPKISNSFRNYALRLMKERKLNIRKVFKSALLKRI